MNGEHIMTTSRIRRNARATARPLLALVAAGGIVMHTTAAQALTTPQLLDELQRTAFLYFWNEANATNGMVKDRSTSGSPCSIAAVGFGLSGICIGIDHGWITRAQGRTRVLTTLQTFWNAPQGPGPSISLAGTTNSVGSTSFLARQTCSAWSRQASRRSNLLIAQPVSPAPNSARAENASTLRHMVRRMLTIA